MTDHHDKLFEKSELMDTQDHSADLGHIQEKKVYLFVLLALLALTVVTVGVTRVDFGTTLNMVVAMAVASAKALLVMLFFMHLKYENKFVKIYAVFPFILLALLMGGIFIDNPFRIASPMVEVQKK